MCSGVGLVLSCVFVLLCIFRDLSLSLLNIMKRSSPASFEINRLCYTHATISKLVIPLKSGAEPGPVLGVLQHGSSSVHPM